MGEHIRIYCTQKKSHRSDLISASPFTNNKKKPFHLAQYAFDPNETFAFFFSPTKKNNSIREKPEFILI